MKKIGILYGRERSFPQAFIERVNSKNVKGIVAEPVRIDKVMQGVSSGYAVIFDRISQDVPFYRAFLKNAALCGTAVINNPFWWSADEKFFNNCLATKIGVPVPKTADRNNNGIIDAIDDTVSLIEELVAIGYDKEKDIRYLELQDGRHDVPTWGMAFPEFLKWGWGVK